MGWSGPLFFAPLLKVSDLRPIYFTNLFIYFIHPPNCPSEKLLHLTVARMTWQLPLRRVPSAEPLRAFGRWKAMELPCPLGKYFPGSLHLSHDRRLDRSEGWLPLALLGPIHLRWGLLHFLFFYARNSPACSLLPKSCKTAIGAGDDKYYALERLEKKPFSNPIKLAPVLPFIIIFTVPIVVFMSTYLSFVYGLLYLPSLPSPIALPTFAASDWVCPALHLSPL